MELRAGHPRALVIGILMAVAVLSTDCISGVAALQESTTWEAAGDSVFNITSYGAVGDGTTDCTKAFLAAIRAASEATGHSSVYVPAGTFLTSPLHFEDCKNTWLVVEGVILAPDTPAGWLNQSHLIKFTTPTNCGVQGVASDSRIDGAGHKWWSLDEDKEDIGGDDDARSLIFFTGLMHGYPQPGVRNITLVNAPKGHIRIANTNMYQGVEITNVLIQSEDNGSVEGVVTVNASFLMNKCTIDVGGNNILAKTEHGDSSRSYLGASSTLLTRGRGMVLMVTDGIMANVSVSDVTFKDTQYGISVLGAKDGSGEFEQGDLWGVVMDNVGVPLNVDNTLCPPGHHGCKNESKGVRLNVFVELMQATQTSGIAGEFHCDDVDRCFVGLGNVTVAAASPSGQNKFVCENVKGTADKEVQPKPCFSLPVGYPGAIHN